jgi:hypothetical protein
MPKPYSCSPAWAEENIEETFSFYRLPRQHHKNLKSTNMLERLMEEIKRRTLVVRIFPNAAACLPLVRALAVETHENWIEAMQYLNMEPLREQKKKHYESWEMPPPDDFYSAGRGEALPSRPRPGPLPTSKVQSDPFEIPEFDKHNSDGKVPAKYLRDHSILMAMVQGLRDACLLVLLCYKQTI